MGGFIPQGSAFALHGVTGERACVIIMIFGIDTLWNETTFFILTLDLDSYDHCNNFKLVESIKKSNNVANFPY